MKRPEPKKHPSKTYSTILPNGKTVRYIAWEGRVWRARRGERRQMSSLLLSGVRISFGSGLRVSAQVREANRLTTVLLDKWGWRCECQQDDCRHIRAVRALTRGS